MTFLCIYIISIDLWYIYMIYVNIYHKGGNVQVELIYHEYASQSIYVNIHWRTTFHFIL